MQVSVVIPTYNRGDALAPTLDALVASDLNQVGEIEIIVVDDGSPVPARSVVDSRIVSQAISLRCIRQTNAGPAAARNTGFRVARGEIVLFVDDDILLPPNAVRDHCHAHKTHPRSVIFGRCPFVEPEKLTPAFRFINSLGYDRADVKTETFIPVEILASGQISCERGLFDVENGVYRDDLATPAAEEYELSYRLRAMGIPIYMAPHIVARHDSPVAIESLCSQQYKHAIGCAEVVAKYPSTLELADLNRVIQVNGDGKGSGRGAKFKRALKKSLSGNRARQALLRTVCALETHDASYHILAPLYRASLGLHFFAGVNDGIRRFGSPQ
jgi:hypothetical protein